MVPRLFLTTALFALAAAPGAQPLGSVPHPQMGPVPADLWAGAPIPTAASVSLPGDDEGYTDAYYFNLALTYYAALAVSNPAVIQQLLLLGEGAPAGAWVPAYAAAGAAYLYLLTYTTTAGQAWLLRRNPATGATTTVAEASPPAGMGWTAMTFSVYTGLLYAIATNCTGLAHLYAIDPLTGTMTQLTQLITTVCIISMAAGLAEHALLLDVELDQLFLLNLVTYAVVALNGPLGFNAAFAQGMGYSFLLNRYYLSAIHNATSLEAGGGGPVGQLRVADVGTDGMPTGSTTYLGDLGDGSVEALYFAFEVPESTASEPGTPATFTLSDVRPNPFTPEAAFTLQLARTEAVRIAVYDATGRAVATLHDGPLAGGQAHAFRLASADLPSGVYLVRVTGESFHATRQATLVR